MIETQKERLHNFFSQYVNPTCRDSYDEDGLFSYDMMRQSVDLLLTEKVFDSKKDMKEEALRDFLVIIPESLFEI